MKNGFSIWHKVYSTRSKLDLSEEPPECKISISVESYDGKTSKNYQIATLPKSA